MNLIPATPIKLKSGQWGARVVGTAPMRADKLQITAANGKTWVAAVESIVWAGNGVALCALFPQAPTCQPIKSSDSTSRRITVGHWECQACEEENPASSNRCWECGCGRK